MSTIEHQNQSRTFQNPFVVESPEKLSPQQIVDLFIRRYTQLDTVQQRRHTFIWGSRGSGKSMMLRYLEPRCQAIDHGGMQAFLDTNEPFLAVYCPCKEGHFNKSELKHLDEYSALIITEHMINLTIADRLVNCLHVQMPTELFQEGECRGFTERVSRLFDNASIAASLEEASQSTDIDDDPLVWLQNLIAIENRKVNTFLRLNALRGGGFIYEGATSGYHDFLVPLTKAVQDIASLASVPVYVLLDDADRLTKEQQTILNTWVANRDQAHLCLKISAPREGYDTFLTRSGGLIQQPHDYSEVDVEELYTRSKSDYYRKVKLIAERRLELAGAPTRTIEEYLPADAGERDLLKTIRRETAQEWERVGKPQDLSDYVDRYSIPRLFQRLSAAKRPKSYAGFDNLVDLSSGVVRDFLEPCYLMFSACISKGMDMTSVKAIPPFIQNEVIRKYSEDFLLTKFEDIRNDLPPEDWMQWDALRTLIESFGRLFYERLHDPKAREARMFSFTVRGQVVPELDSILRLGVRYRYLQMGTYSTKEGGGREKWYILNRRLCPMYKLDPTGFAGRVSITPEFLKLAVEDPASFTRLRLKKRDADEQDASEEQLAFAFDEEGAE